MRLVIGVRRSERLLRCGLAVLLGMAALLLCSGCGAKRRAFVELQAERDSLRVVATQLQGLVADSEVVDILWWGVPPPLVPPLRVDSLERVPREHSLAGRLSGRLPDSVASGGVRLVRHRSQGWQSRAVQAEREAERSELRQGAAETVTPERGASSRLQGSVWGWLTLLFAGLLAVGLYHLCRQRSRSRP